MKRFYFQRIFVIVMTKDKNIKSLKTKTLQQLSTTVNTHYKYA